MLDATEHKHFADLLRKLAKKHPGRSYSQLIYDARRQCRPWNKGAMTPHQEYDALVSYAKYE